MNIIKIHICPYYLIYQLQKMNILKNIKKQLLIKHHFKNLLLKYTLRNKWQDVSSLSGTNAICSVGLLIDETNFFEKEQLIKELISNNLVHQKKVEDGY